MIAVEIIADSINPVGKRITTFILTYPRYILAELNTHRAFSRNTASSRAIPVWKTLLGVIHNPVIPIIWGMNARGMQSQIEMPASKATFCNIFWIISCFFACGCCWILSKLGLHKQWANRIIEPWVHINTILTATELGNFFNLRAHKDAMPEMQELAKQMLLCYKGK